MKPYFVFRATELGSKDEGVYATGLQIDIKGHVTYVWM